MIISFGVFSLLYLAPGSAEQVLLQGRAVDAATRNEIREAFNLNEPFLQQYRLWVSGAIRLDFGESIRTGEPVLNAILNRMGLTIFLGLYGFIVAMVAGLSLGILAAVKSRTSVDRGIVMFSIVGASAPPFVTGVFLLYLFAVLLGWFPAFGQGEGFADRFWHLTLPALALAFGGAALVVRLTRAGMIGALDQDFVTFARARGLSPRRVLRAYALRNALIPVVNAGALMLAFMLTGAALVEVTFALPGIGALLVESVNFRDLPMVQGLSMVLATVVILVNLATDVIYLFIDPRISYSETTA
jgi:peptide/nickel transport system permease protein